MPLLRQQDGPPLDGISATNMMELHLANGIGGGYSGMGKVDESCGLHPRNLDGIIICSCRGRWPSPEFQQAALVFKHT